MAIAARFPNAETSADARHVNRPGKADPVPDNFEQFIQQVWGDGIGKHFALPYNQKMHRRTQLAIGGQFEHKA